MTPHLRVKCKYLACKICISTKLYVDFRAKYPVSHKNKKINTYKLTHE